MPSVGNTHHIKLGDYHLMLRPGGYTKRPAPQFGSRISSGDPDYNNLSIWQHWVQTCWVGGLGAEAYNDDSMYDIGVGIDTTIHEQCSLSRDLTLSADTAGVAGALNPGSLNVVRKFHIYKRAAAGSVAKLYCLVCPPNIGTTSYLWEWLPASSSWGLVNTGTRLNNWRAQCITTFAGEMVIGGENGSMFSAENPAGTWTVRNPPAGVTVDVTAFKAWGQRLYVAHGRYVWRRMPDWTVDGSTVFFEATGSDAVNDFQAHLGYLYFSSRNGHVHRTDGNNTFDIWSWDGNTFITSLCSFDGRLFVATYEYTDLPDQGQGSLYQLTGSSVTQLKKWGLFARATSLGRMVVYDRKMWYGASGLWGMNVNTAGTDLGGFGVAVYDAVEDAHSIWATNKDALPAGTYPDASGIGRDWMVDDVVFFQGAMHVSVRKFGLFRSPISYRDYLQDRAQYDMTTTTATGAASGGFLQSSDYDGGTPGLLKLWRQMLVQCDLASDAASVRVSYSLDQGRSWTLGGTISRQVSGTVATSTASAVVTGTGTRFRTEVMPKDVMRFGSVTKTVLSVDGDTQLTLTTTAGATQAGVAAIHNKIRQSRALRLNDVRGARFMYRLELQTTNAAVSPVVKGISVSYLPQPEPNWMWDLTVVLSTKQMLLDGTIEEAGMDGAPALSTISNAMSNYSRSQTPVQFIDIDGTQWEIGGGKGVLVYDYREDRHVQGKAGEPVEMTMRFTLLELAESY